MNAHDEKRLALSHRLCARIEPSRCSLLALGIRGRSQHIGASSGRTGSAPSSVVVTAAYHNAGMRLPSLIATSFFSRSKASHAKLAPTFRNHNRF